MPDAMLDWLDTLPDLRVSGVPGVPPQFSATFLGTPSDAQGVPGVPGFMMDGEREHLGTPAEHRIASRSPLICKEEHPGTPGTPYFRDGAGDASLPAEIIAGLDRLESERGPRITIPEAWPFIVADALRFARDGWAAKALALGWPARMLFGASPEPDGDPYLDGVAVWLQGRRIVLIDADTIVVSTSTTQRSQFNRYDRPGTVFLWELADVQCDRIRRGR